MEFTFKEKVESVTIHKSKWFDGIHDCYTVDVNGEEYLGLPMGLDECLEAVDEILENGYIERYGYTERVKEEHL